MTVSREPGQTWRNRCVQLEAENHDLKSVIVGLHWQNQMLRDRLAELYEPAYLQAEEKVLV
jgi:hypothetical protein